MAPRVGPFELLKSIGVGGMAEVWSGVHGPSQTMVAVKILRQSGDRALRAAFRREVRAAAALDHPHIARIWDQGETGPDEAFAEGTAWLAMELARQGTLRDRRGKLAWAQLQPVLLQVLDALSHAHARRVIHRDIKPDNVLMGEHGPLLADFGLAHRFVGIGGGAPAGGSPAYMAPEQFRRAEAEMGPWTDLYGVGCLAWALATGKPPFTGLESPDEFRNAHVFKDPPDFSPRRSVPAGFERWVRALLAKAPASRPRTAADAAWALKQLDEHWADEPTTTGSLPSSPPEAIRGSETWHDMPLGDFPTPLPLAEQPGFDVVPPPFPTTWRTAATPDRPPIPGVGLGLLGTREGSLVGRESERDALWAELGRVHDEGRPRAVILRGDAGVGTGRLALWLARRSHETGAATTLNTTHSPVAPPGAGLAWAVANLLRSGPLSFEEASDRILRNPDLIRLSDPVDRAAIAVLVDRLHTGRAASRTEVDAAMSGLLRALGADRPVLFWLERAAHSSTTLAWVGRLLEQDELPVLVVLSVRESDLAERPTESALLQGLADHPSVSTLPIGPVPEVDRPALVRSILPLEPELARRIEERTAGHPGFTAELIRDLVSRDLLVPTDRGYAEREPVELPEDLSATWTRRLDAVLPALPDEAVRALTVASMLWTDIVDESWLAICERCQVADPTGATEPLLAAGLAKRLPDDRGWSFAAGLRDATLARARVDRVELHRICAEIVRERDGGAETEAWHLVAAGDTEAAKAPLLQAASERVALGHYNAALELLERRAEGMRTNDPSRGAGEILRATVARFQGQPDRADELLDALEPWLDEPGWEQPAAEVAMGRGAIAYLRGRTWEAVEFLRQAEERFLALGRRVSGLPGCRVHLADCLMRLGRLEEARDALEAGLTGFRHLGHRSGAANAMLALAGLSLRTGELDDADRWLTRAATAYAELGVRFGLAEVHNRMGELARQRGMLDDAEDHYRRAIDGFGAIGASDTVIPRLNLGLVQVQRGKWRQAIEVLEKTAAEARAQGRDLADACTVLLLPCYGAVDRWDDFDTSLADARKLLRQSGMVHPDIADQAMAAARICADAGHLARSRTTARIAKEQWRRLSRMDHADEVDRFLRTLPTQ